MKILKVVLFLLILCPSVHLFAGGMMKGGGPSLNYIVFILALIFLGIPLSVGTITALISKTKKKRNFFIATFTTLGIILLSLLVLIVMNS